MTNTLALGQAYGLAEVRDSKGVSLYKNISLALVFMSSPSLLVDKILDVTIHNLSIGNGLIFLNLLWLAGISMRTTSLSRLQKAIFTYFLLIIFFFVAVWIALYGLNLTGSGPRGMIRTFFHGLCFFVILNDPRFDMRRFNRFMIKFALCLAVLSLILYYGCLFGKITLRAVHPSGYGHNQIYLEGFGGYLNTYDNLSRYGFLFRSQSYFSEPTNFAQFLIVPLFLAWETLRRNKHGKNVLTFGLLVFAFVLTFSVANFFGAFVALVAYFVLRKGKSTTTSFRIRVVVFNLLMLLTIAYFLHDFYLTTEKKHLTTSVIARGTTENIINRKERFETAMSVLKYSLFGDLRFREQFTANPGLLGGTIIDGGVIVCGLLILLLAQLFTAIFRRFRRSEYLLIYMGSLAYFVAFFWDGQLHENYFLFFIALYTTYIKLDKDGVALL
ncbi:MAG: hypothetical protein ACE5IY_22075 [bacterium]